MKLPNKVTPYKESILALFPDILFLILQADSAPIDLYLRLKKTKMKHISIGTFIQALDCLYYLGKIELKENRIHYVS